MPVFSELFQQARRYIPSSYRNRESAVVGGMSGTHAQRARAPGREQVATIFHLTSSELRALSALGFITSKLAGK